jgi:hypothetical protein
MTRRCIGIPPQPEVRTWSRPAYPGTPGSPGIPRWFSLVRSVSPPWPDFRGCARRLHPDASDGATRTPASPGSGVPDEDEPDPRPLRPVRGRADPRQGASDLRGRVRAVEPAASAWPRLVPDRPPGTAARDLPPLRRGTKPAGRTGSDLGADVLPAARPQAMAGVPGVPAPTTRPVPPRVAARRLRQLSPRTASSRSATGATLTMSSWSSPRPMPPR